MQIVIIGTGNTATVVSKKLKAAGHSIIQVFGRNPEAAALLAGQLNAAACSAWNAITIDAELYIIALADKAITTDTIQLRLKDQLVVHTAGAVSMDILKKISSSYGVLYPFQSIRKEIEILPDIPLLIDASSDAAKEKLMALAKTISFSVRFADDATRMKYHLCAVMTNNFSNYLYAVTEDYCKKQALDFHFLLPLIDETARRLHHFSPRSVQTGPAIRGDMTTIEHHLQLLKDEPELQKIYSFFTEQILRS